MEGLQLTPGTDKKKSSSLQGGNPNTNVTSTTCTTEG